MDLSSTNSPSQFHHKQSVVFHFSLHWNASYWCILICRPWAYIVPLKLGERTDLNWVITSQLLSLIVGKTRFHIICLSIMVVVLNDNRCLSGLWTSVLSFFIKQSTPLVHIFLDHKSFSYTSTSCWWISTGWIFCVLKELNHGAHLTISGIGNRHTVLECNVSIQSTHRDFLKHINDILKDM